MQDYALTPPYALYTGSVTDPRMCKTATGILRWRPDLVACQVVDDAPNAYRLPGVPCVGHAELARAHGAKSMVIATNTGGEVLTPECRARVIEFRNAHMDVVNTLHVDLANDQDILRELHRSLPGKIVDVRVLKRQYPLATGKKRRGLRLLTVGSDGCVGKMFTALTITRELKKHGVKCTFRPTGQTGLLIAPDHAIVADSTPADFVSGAAEWLTPENEPDHWDIVEGQGSLFHPAWCADTLGLIMGTQPDGIVYCIDPSRDKQDHTDHYVMDLHEDVLMHLRFARRVNPDAVFAGFAINASAATEAQVQDTYCSISRALHLLLRSDPYFGLHTLIAPGCEHAVFDSMEEGIISSKAMRATLSWMMTRSIAMRMGVSDTAIESAHLGEEI